MAEVTHENIKALIESAKQEGSLMRCTFKCPVSGTLVEAQAGIQKGRGLGDIAKRSVKRSLSWRIRYGISRLVRSALGHGIAGRIAGDVAGSAVSGTMSKGDQVYSEDEKQAAVVQAFLNVSTQFVWDGSRSTWVSSQAAAAVLTDFAKLLNDRPVDQTYDRGVLARMLVEVARADGNLADEEKEFLAGFISSDLGSIDELAKKPLLSPAELAETTGGGVRDTMLMIAWGLACTDKNLAGAETRRLAELAKGFQIGEARTAELKRFAQQFVIDQALDHVYPDGKLDSAAQSEVFQFAQGIGLERSEAERVEIRYRKRNGLV
ncbi:MAG: TerB family tellurite resistance protein [Deltaproteobacteria bacterium]|nr:TerB family tellurite resistance protein [Deltaproteobacteria bacterium]